MPSVNRDVEELRMDSPRPETPEPATRQGRRNGAEGVQLLDDDGAISVQVRIKMCCIVYCCLTRSDQLPAAGILPEAYFREVLHATTYSHAESCRVAVST